MRFKNTMYIVCACFTGVSFSADAALVTGNVLEFVPGTQVCTIGGIPPLCDLGATDIAGSYFALDGNANGTFDTFEKLMISMHDGLKIGVAQPASGSHTGVANGTETPGIDNPWNFSGNTGMHQSLSPVTEVAPGLLDFSGWGITWNAIPIALGGDQANFPGDSGLATVICDTAACLVGEGFVLDYTAHVPINDPSNFGRVPYKLHLEGVVSAVPVPAAVWLFGSGLLLLTGAYKQKAHT